MDPATHHDTHRPTPHSATPTGAAHRAARTQRSRPDGTTLHGARDRRTNHERNSHTRRVHLHTLSCTYGSVTPVTKTSLRDTPIYLILWQPYIAIGWELCVPVRTCTLVAPWRVCRYRSPRTAPSRSRDKAATSIAGAQQSGNDFTHADLGITHTTTTDAEAASNMQRSEGERTVQPKEVQSAVRRKRSAGHAEWSPSCRSNRPNMVKWSSSCTK